MSDDDFDNSPPTRLDRAPDWTLEHKTPLPVVGEPPDACTECFVRSFKRVGNEAIPPWCARVAQEMTTCTATQDGVWTLCAAKMFLNVLMANGARARIYMGPERRGQRLPIPSGLGERRKVPGT